MYCCQRIRLSLRFINELDCEVSDLVANLIVCVKYVTNNFCQVFLEHYNYPVQGTAAGAGNSFRWVQDRFD